MFEFGNKFSSESANRSANLAIKLCENSESFCTKMKNSNVSNAHASLKNPRFRLDQQQKENQ